MDNKPIRGLRSSAIDFICDDYWVDGQLKCMTAAQYNALTEYRKTHKDSGWMPYDFPLYEKIADKCKMFIDRKNA